MFAQSYFAFSSSCPTVVVYGIVFFFFPLCFWGLECLGFRTNFYRNAIFILVFVPTIMYCEIFLSLGITLCLFRTQSHRGEWSCNIFNHWISCHACMQSFFYFKFKYLFSSGDWFYFASIYSLTCS